MTVGKVFPPPHFGARMKTIVHRVAFKASPNELYRAYMDPKRHAKLHGGAKATVSPRVGGRMSAWDGYCWGDFLALVPNRLIVQTWRTTDWKRSDADSILFLTLEPTRTGTRLTMVHAQVPDHQARSLDQGWRDHYWTPMKRLAKATSGRQRLSST